MLFILEPAYDWVQSAEAPFFVAVVAGGLIAALFGVLVGIPLLRLGDDYLGMATLGFAEIVRVVAMNIPRVTNGALGSKASRIMPTSGGISAGASHPVCHHPVDRSNSGNVFKAIRDDETGQGHGDRRFPPKAFVLHHRGVLRRRGGLCWGACWPPLTRRCSPSF